MPLFDKQKSRVKMLIMLKNGNDHLKLRSANGVLSCPVQYSILSKDKKPLTKIINGMAKRFKEKNTLFTSTNCLIFIDQKTNEQVDRIDF